MFWQRILGGGKKQDVSSDQTSTETGQDMDKNQPSDEAEEIYPQIDVF